MSENTTQDQNGARPFEERVISILNELRERVAALEIKSYDTKPIWERALAEVTELRREQTKMQTEVTELRFTTERGFRSLERKLDVFNQDLLDLRDGQRRMEDSFQKQR